MKNTFNFFGDINIQHQHVNIDPVAFPHDINDLQVPAPAEAARPDAVNPPPAPNAAPNLVPNVDGAPAPAPAVIPDVNRAQDPVPAIVPDFNRAPVPAPAIIPNVDRAVVPAVNQAVLPDMDDALALDPNLVPAVNQAVLPDMDDALALDPNPLPAPRRGRARRGDGDSLFVCDDPRFWRKIRKLPHHLRFVFLPGCDLWDFRVSKEYLRLIIQHFAPGLFILQRTCKAGYIVLFHEHVLRPYGARYRVGN